MSRVEYDDVDQGLDVAKVEKELKEARQLKAARDKILAAGRRRGTKRRHVVVSFTLDELAEAVGVSKRTLQWWRKTRRVDLADRAAVVALLRQGDAVRGSVLTARTCRTYPRTANRSATTAIA